MSLAPGLQLGPYEVTSLLGSGGMGEVYRAKDTKLNRDVALKVLPEAFTADPDRLVRFKREAQVLASLNHPNIAAIYGFEESAGIRALVLELVEGPTLADRIAHGPIPIDEALPIGKQIAEALEAAHERGIIHRDLKPANVKIRPDGAVKVLDFGLAKALDSTASTVATVTTSPTITSPAMTRMGVILGTAAYMSPEQARGKPVDRRADIWAFGSLLFEMLSGGPAFGGETVTDTLASIVKEEPRWTDLPANTPPGIRKLIARTLEKDPQRRLQAIGEARIAIDETAREPLVGRPPIHSGVSRRTERFGWIAALIVISVIALATVPRALRPVGSVPTFPETYLEITTPRTTDLGSLAISPDGRKLVFAASAEGRPQLWLRSLDSSRSARPLAGTELGSLPFWSPDGQSIGFFADGKLKRIDINGGAAQVLAPAGLGMGGAWLQDGTILFVPRSGSPILRLAVDGATHEVTRLESGQTAHRHPRMLPDGRHFLFYVFGGPGINGIYIGELDRTNAKRLFDADSGAEFAAPGQLLFVRQGTMYAQPFDPVRLVLTGNTFPVAERVAVGAFNSAGLSVSPAGHVVYRSGSSAQRQFVWFDRSGKPLAQLGVVDSADARDPWMSPDGSRIVLRRITSGNTDIWFLDTARGLLDRFTSDGAGNGFPVWAPDGTQIVFNKATKIAGSHLYRKSTRGAGTEELLLAAAGSNNASDWSRDGQFLLFRHTEPTSLSDIWALPIAGDRKPFPVVQTNSQERDAQFSPDGKWIAYQSDDSGQFEIYVQRFPDGGGKERISTNGGAQVRWRADGTELFYVALDDRLMAVPIKFTSNRETVEPGSPVQLFMTQIGGAVQGVARQQYMVSSDGQRFLMNTVPDDVTAPITVILNWKGKP